MSDAATLHPTVLELMSEFSTEGGELRLTEAQFLGWAERLRGLSPAQKEPVTRDLVVLAARFQREARETTEWAVQALMYLAMSLAEGIEQAERIAAGLGLELPEELVRGSQAAEAVKSAPAVRAGRSRSVDPAILAQHLARRR